jgi:putative transposase
MPSDPRGAEAPWVHVAEVLDEVVETRGKPVRIFLDNGPEFISKALDLWAYQSGVTLDFSRPGKPTDNAYGKPKIPVQPLC